MPVRIFAVVLALGGAVIGVASGLASVLPLQGAAALARGAIVRWRGDPTASPGLVRARAGRGDRAGLLGGDARS